MPLELYHPSEDYLPTTADYLPMDKETVNLFGVTLSSTQSREAMSHKEPELSLTEGTDFEVQLSK